MIFGKNDFWMFWNFCLIFFSWFWAPLPLPSIFTHSWRQSGVQTNFGSPSWKYLLLFFRIVFWEDTVIYLHSHTPSSHFRANPMRFETFPIERVYFLTNPPDPPGLSESTLWGFTTGHQWPKWTASAPPLHHEPGAKRFENDETSIGSNFWYTRIWIDSLKPEIADK